MGLDPLFDTVLPKEMAKAAGFSARVASETVPLLENGASVHVVGHRVQWDDARKLWYCDIELDAGWRTYMPFVRLALVRYQPHAIGGAKVSRVTLAEFAQVLPRRAATLQRSTQLVAVPRAGTLAAATLGTAVSATAATAIAQRPQTVHTVSLRGPVPARGPMLYTNDSAHLNISFVPLPGTALEAGRNKVELVLQTRAANLDSDLAWTDVATLHSALALPPGQVDTVPGSPLPRGAGAPASLFDEAAQAAPATVTRSGSLGELQQFEDRIALDDEAVRSGVTATTAAVSEDGHGGPGGRGAAGGGGEHGADRPGDLAGQRHLPASQRQAGWCCESSSATTPTARCPIDAAARPTASAVVEERLVYSEFFPLDWKMLPSARRRLPPTDARGRVRQVSRRRWRPRKHRVERSQLRQDIDHALASAAHSRPQHALEEAHRHVDAARADAVVGGSRGCEPP